MTPMLGIMASAISGNLWAPGKDYDSIATVTVGATSVADITFSSIPATYKHLQIRLFGLSTRTGTTVDSIWMQLNSDTGANYSDHLLRGDGATDNSYADVSVSNAFFGYNAPTGYTNAGSVNVIDILDYANTSKYTTMRTLGGLDNNGAGYVYLSSGSWRNTAAVATIKLAASTFSWAQYTSAALYGIK